MNFFSDIQILAANRAARSADLSEVKVITLDSRKSATGCLFVAAKGATKSSTDGHSFIQDAIQSGAFGVIVERFDPSFENLATPIWQVVDARKTAAILCERLSGNPSHQLKILGITGTNGKTSTTFFASSMLAGLRVKSAVLGTLGVGDPNETLRAFGFTTPEAENLSPLLKTLVEDGFSHVCMEVSSHALTTKRVDGVQFAVAGFTNLSPEHLDFHETMDQYRLAKDRLFLELLPKGRPCVLPVGHWLQKELEKSHPVITWGFAKHASVEAIAHATNNTGLLLTLRIEQTIQEIQTQLFGDFNIENLICAAASILALGFSPAQVFQALPYVKPVLGRMQRVPFTGPVPKPIVIIDFAHTPDALERSLKTARAFCQNKLHLVFGCGGNRDTQKREVCGEIGARYSDYFWITDDNPRFENPKDIRDAILRGAQRVGASRVEVIGDRREAIFSAIHAAAVGDVVLIAGKGHEQTQQVKDQFLPFDDLTIAQLAFGV